MRCNLNHTSVKNKMIRTYQNNISIYQLTQLIDLQISSGSCIQELNVYLKNLSLALDNKLKPGTFWGNVTMFFMS